MNVKGILALLGFAQKAGKIAAGEAAVENFLTKGRLALLLVSIELSENRKREWQRQADLYHVTLLIIDITKIEMGLALGMSPRGIIGIKDQNMAEAIMKKLQE